MFDTLRRKKGMALKFCQLIEYERRNSSVENHAGNVPQKLVPDPFLILVNNPKQPLHARNRFKNKIFWKRIMKKPLKS